METGKKAKSITIMVDDQTKYSGPNGKISFSNLQVGENVTVKGTLDNQGQAFTASNVTVTLSSNATPTP
jgi:cytochrome c biogenesis protein ResB